MQQFQQQGQGWLQGMLARPPLAEVLALVFLLQTKPLVRKQRVLLLVPVQLCLLEATARRQAQEGQ